jgi:hypothetical protein
LVVSVMNERLRRLALSATQPNGTLQTLALDGAHAVCGELSAIIRFGTDRKAARQAAASIRRPRNDFPPHGGKETHPHRITCRMPVRALYGSRRCKELTPKTTESHWSGGQREP